MYRYTEDEVLAVAGWDSVVYLRTLRFGEPSRCCTAMGCEVMVATQSYLVALQAQLAGHKLFMHFHQKYLSIYTRSVSF